ncbi:E3 ubiquitin-protein ligase MYLIP [Lamellibrachia satsuma]|nr:E3 ubiquitin-protein ligase MYLIP [Lamellibrachia satsuma]
MLCFVTQPNLVVLEVQLDSKSNGQECLEKVCQQLGIIELDYFGLQYTGEKGEQLWLNLRNDITRQLIRSPPYRFRLRVKFFVEPHYILQETTRHQFYLNIKQEFFEGHMKAPSHMQAVRTTALISQVELGNYSQQASRAIGTGYTTFAPSNSDKNFSVAVAVAHTKLESLDRIAAEYKLLQEVSTWNCYGVEYHKIRSGSAQVDQMGVGPNGIALYDKDGKLVKTIEYPAIRMATLTRKCLFLETVCDDGSTTILNFQLHSQKAANGLYRCVTEMYSFYLCDTVRSTVASQYSRDLKGILAALFNENTTLGKKYIFDIQRTFREAYDHARRQLYRAEIANRAEGSVNSNWESEVDSCQQQQCPDSSDYLLLEERVRKIEDALTCHVCMDRDINCAFCPCGHVVCCLVCANKLDKCPLCRSEVEKTQQIYLPNLHITDPDLRVPVVSS